MKKCNLSYNDCNKYDIGYVFVMCFKEVFVFEIENELSILLNVLLILFNNKEEFFKNRIIFGIRNE